MATKVVDSKGRIALGNRFAGRTVIIDDSNPERIVITPAVVIPESEAWLYQNERVLNSIRKGLDEARRGQFANETPELDADSELIEQMEN